MKLDVIAYYDEAGDEISLSPLYLVPKRMTKMTNARKMNLNKKHRTSGQEA
jgi:hypothetical protein